MKKLIFIKIFISIALTSSITPKQIDIIFNICSTKNYSQDDLHIVHFVYEKFRGSSEDTQSLIDAIIEKQTE